MAWKDIDSAGKASPTGVLSVAGSPNDSGSLLGSDADSGVSSTARTHSDVASVPGYAEVSFGSFCVHKPSKCINLNNSPSDDSSPGQRRRQRRVFLHARTPTSPESRATPRWVPLPIAKGRLCS